MTKVVEEEHSRANFVKDVEVIEMSNVSITTNLDIMHQTTGTINLSMSWWLLKSLKIWRLSQLRN